MEVNDLEDEIGAFFLRKNAGDTEREQRKQYVPKKDFPVVTLLVQDVLTVNTSHKDFVTAFEGSLQFKQCIIYGRIVGYSGASKQCTTYIVEDGTACIDVTVFNKNKEKQDVTRLKQEVESCEKEELKGPLRRILSVSEKLLDIFHLLPGTRIIVLGRPSVYREKLSLVSDNLFVDEGIERTLEIAFKDSLIEHMKQYSKPSK